MIPELTDEQRKENLQKAMQMRQARSKIRQQLTDGILSVSDVFNLAASGNKAAAGMRVKQLINALPGYGFKRTQNLMHALGIAESKRVAGLGGKQQAALLQKLDGAA